MRKLTPVPETADPVVVSIRVALRLVCWPGSSEASSGTRVNWYTGVEDRVKPSEAKVPSPLASAALTVTDDCWPILKVKLAVPSAAVVTLVVET